MIKALSGSSIKWDKIQTRNNKRTKFTNLFAERSIMREPWCKSAKTELISLFRVGSKGRQD